MTRHPSTLRRALLLVAAAAVGSACTDAPTAPSAPSAPPPPRQQAVKFWDDLASVRWNTEATRLLQQQVGLPNGQAWASRMLTYLSLAQYRAVQEATKPTNRPTHASVSAAVARASVLVLDSFFRARPGLSEPARLSIVAGLDQLYLAEQNLARWPGGKNQDVAAGEAIGAGVARDVWIQASGDHFVTNQVPLPPRDTRPGYWVPLPITIPRSLYGVTPFFLAKDELLLSRMPPAVGSPELIAAAEEVWNIVRVEDPIVRAAQDSIARQWNRVAPAGPFTAGEWNRTAVELIQGHHRKEAEATRILAYANAAAFDAQIMCFTTKFTRWVPRPYQVKPEIIDQGYVVINNPIPNHPSYPSAHSCISSAFGAVLSDAFPSERPMLEAMVAEAGWSRIYGGIHYQFDIEAGHEVGEITAAKALAGSLK